MREITSNEMRLILALFKSPEIDYHAQALARFLEISAMGALKIARRLEKEGLLNSKWIGRAKIYEVNMKNAYVRDYICFLLKKEAEEALAHVKMWIHELQSTCSADIAIVFGSLLRKKDARDVDVLFVVSQKKFKALKLEIDKINRMNMQQIHPLFQSKQDVLRNVKKEDKILLNALKGIVAFGHEKLIDLVLSK